MIKSTKPVVVNAVSRHPALVRRDELYASAKSHPRLTDDGKLRVSPTPLATDLIGLRPMSKEEQIARYTGHGIIDFNLIPDENFLSEDDFHDYLDDVPEEGLSPYELLGLQNIERVWNAGKDYISPAEGDDSSPATPVAEGAAERPQEAGKAAPSASAKAD